MAYNNSVSSVTGHTPYFLHYGRRARLPLTRLMHTDRPLDDRLNDVAHALRTAAQLTAESRHHNRERLARESNCGEFKPGQSVVIKVSEPLSLTSHWEPQWEIIKTKDKTVTIRHQQSGTIKTLNINKVRIVDPNIAWDQLLKRPIRNQRLGPRKMQTTKLLGTQTPLTHAPAKRAPSTKRPNTSKRPHSPPSGRTQQDQHSTPEAPRLAVKREGSQLEQPQFRRPPQPPPPIDAHKRRQHRQLTHVDLKRFRPYIPRASKRQAPPLDTLAQKKQRIDTIAQVKSFLSSI